MEGSIGVMMWEISHKMDTICWPMTYKGNLGTLPSLDDLKLFEDGDVITVGDKQYLYDNDMWILIGDPEDVAHDDTKTKLRGDNWPDYLSERKLQPQVCTCCGGKLDHNNICMYCGVRYG